jgi:beta-glucanase (GH16 family)
MGIALTSGNMALPQHAAAQQLKLVWSDEFNYKGPLDPTKWTFEIGNGNNGWGNRELEYYTDRLENTFVDGKNANMVARKEEYNGFHYTASKFHSNATWQYGVVEMRAKLPTGRGMWPSVWLVPQHGVYGSGGWPDNGEIDMMEQVAYDPESSHFSLHQNRGDPTRAIAIPTLTSAYHIYRMEWDPDHITGYLDGHEYFRYNRGNQDWRGWPYDQPFHINLNFAVGGTWGGADGVDDSVFPQTYSIDYVRVYKKVSKPHGGTARSLAGTVEAVDYDDGGEGYAFHADPPANVRKNDRGDLIAVGPSGAPNHPDALGGIEPSQWMNYTVQASEAGTYDLTFYVATPYHDGRFDVEVDDNRVARLRVPDTGSWSTWQGVTVPGVKLSAGQHVVRILSGWDDWSFSYFETAPSANAPANGSTGP